MVGLIKCNRGLPTGGGDMTDALERERSDQASDTLYPRRLARQEKPRLSLSFSITSLHNQSRKATGSTMCTAILDGPCRPRLQPLSRSPAAYLLGTQLQSQTIGHVLSKTLMKLVSPARITEL